MALARYRDQFWFPNGAFAANIQARVFPLGSSVLASLFTDVSGATPLANPLSTNGSGFLEFWAEEGEYWIHIDTESFRVQVGSPNLDVFEVAASSVSTGVVWGGQLNLNPSAPQSVDIAAMVGYVVDHATDEIRPTATRVVTAAQTVSLDAAALSRPLTHWLMTSSGTIIQQATRPTPTQRRNNIWLGLTVYSNTAGAVIVAKSTPVALSQPGQALADFLEAVGPFNIDGGNVVSPNGTNLMLDKTGGSVFSHNLRHYFAGARTKDPSTVPTPAQSPVEFAYTTRNDDDLSVTTFTVDPTQYDNAGVLTPVGGGSSRSTIQRIWLAPTDNIANQVVVQYGQETFSSLTAAVNAIGEFSFVQRDSVSEVAPLIGWLAVTRTATDLSDTTQARFVAAGKFARP